jgi:hypothetical protein
MTRDEIVTTILKEIESLEALAVQLKGIKFPRDLRDPLQRVMGSSGTIWHRAKQGLELLKEDEFTIVKLKNTTTMRIKSSLPGVVTHYKTKYKCTVEPNGYGHFEFEIPNGTIGVITSITVDDRRRRATYRIGIPNPVTGEIGQHGVLTLEEGTFKFDVPEHEKETVEASRAKLIGRRVKNNFDALKKIRETGVLK